MNDEIMNRFKASEQIFRCPLCATQMAFKNQNSLVCTNQHCFDLSRHGYINFAPQQTKMKYSKYLFESRRDIFQAGFYNPLIKSIRQLIDEYFDGLPNLRVLDAGCGEGFFIANLFDYDEQIGEIFATDILKDAIILASKENDVVKWFVGDLANIPLQSGMINLLLNILAPANYCEFQRVMNDGGLLIKVVPGKQYLQELRVCAGEQLTSKEYSNEQVLQCFHRNMNCIGTTHLFYQLPVSGRQLESFIKMTPMMFHVDTTKMNLHSIKQITIDVEIMAGKSCNH